MGAVLSVILPVFALIGLGYLSRRRNVLGPTAVVELNRFVTYLATPALLFQITARTSLAEIWQPAFVLAFGGALAVTFFATLLLAMRRMPAGEAVVDALSASYSNCGFMGIPMTLLIFGQSALPFSGLSVIFTACILFAFGLIGMELSALSGDRLHVAIAKTVLNLCRNPLMVAPVAGCLVAAAGWHVPQSIKTFVDLLAGATVPCALVTLGLFLADNFGSGVGSEEPVGRDWIALSATKLVGQPAIAWLIAGPLLHAPPRIVAVAMLQALMPTGAGPFMLAQVYGKRGAVASRVILATTIVSMFTLAAFLALPVSKG